MQSKVKYGMVLGFAGLAGLAAVSVFADAPAVMGDANPYSIISDRNVFHLNPPPPPPAAPEPKPVDLPKVMLTGFVGKGDSVKVLLAIPPTDNKDSIHYATLMPGDKQDGVELVRINLKDEAVDIVNSGTPQTLTVKSNSYMASAAAPPAGKPPPGMPPGLRRPPGIAPPGFHPPAAASAMPFGSGSSGPIIAGGNSSGGYSGSGVYNPSSSSGAIISGGYSPPPLQGANNNIGNQVAASLFNPATGHYQMPVQTAPPAPPEVQAAQMLIREAAGGPPSPVQMENGQGGPVPPGPPGPQ
ncbi:MAG TPA: hypothetical protein VGO59_03505 [Verrucomicrobiae bacterium]